MTYLGTLGNSFNYNNLCFAENEEKLPEGWKPLHVQKDYKSEESIVSLFSGWTLVVFSAIKPNPRHEIIMRQLSVLETSGTGAHFIPGTFIGGNATLLLSPLVANELVKEGYGTKESLSDWIKEKSYMSMWNYWIAKPDDLKAAESGEEPFASLLKLPPDARSTQPLISPESPVDIIVVGGETDQPWQAGDFRYITSASVDYWR